MRHRSQARIAQRNQRVAVAVALALLLAGCESTRETLKDYEEGPLFGRGPGLEARLRGTGSAATGNVRIFDFRDGVAVQLTMYNVPPGTYRIALHENANCSSPNLFSAGPAWAPPGSGKTAADLMPQFYVNTGQDMPNYTAYFNGARVDGPLSLRGRSVVIHYGQKISDAFPGQPNNRIACGVLEFIRRNY
jgi:Cu/Zn superoxide dismutase